MSYAPLVRAFRIEILSVLLFGASLANAAGPAPLGESEIFVRCYQRMVRDVPDDTHPLLVAVKAGTMKGADACMSLFAEAQIATNGVMVNRASPEAKRILKTFHDFHRTFFTSKTHLEFKPMTYMLKDSEEGALYFTRAAFQKNVTFKSVVTGNEGLQGIRDREAGETGNDFQTQRIVTYSSQVPYTGRPDAYISVGGNAGVQSSAPYRLVIPGDQVIQMGDLVGIRAAKSIVFPDFVGIIRAKNTLPGEEDPVTAAAEINKASLSMRNNFDANRHMGGGIIGTQTFMLNNSGLSLAEPTQGSPTGALASEGGEAINNRRLASRIFEDLLCHRLPTLTLADGESRVHANSPLTFRNDRTCQQCHAQMDQAANVLRSLYIFRSGIDIQDGFTFNGVQRLPASSSAKTFALKPPTGRLFYRQNLTGERVVADVDSIQDMGAEFAARDDLYRCAAKRYYKFLTGVDVSLVTKATAADDKVHQDFVLSLAKELKADQSVSGLVRRIVSSGAFRARNYQPEAP